MSESLTALYLQNPELANALRRRQQAQQQVAQGADSSPVHHWAQGAARLAQALIGGYEQGEADREIKGIGERRRSMADALMAPYAGPGSAAPQPGLPRAQPEAPGTPATVQQQALAPPDLEPLIAQASQATGVPAHILTGLYAQESGFRPDAANPRSTARGIGQVLASTAANPGFGMQPLADADRMDPAKAIPWSAQYLAARAKAAGLSDWTNPDQVSRALRAYGEDTPQYASAVMGRAGFTTPTAAPGSPQAPQRQPGTQDLGEAKHYEQQAMRAFQAGDQQLAALLMQRAQRAQQAALARQPGEMKVVPDPSSPSGYRYVPSAQAGGMAAPPPSALVNVDQKGETTFAQERGKSLAARATEYEEADTKAAGTLGQLRLLERFMKDARTGAFAERGLQLGRVADMLGVPENTRKALGLDPNAVASGEALKSITARMMTEMIGPGGFPAANFSNADAERLAASLPSLLNSERGNKLIVDFLRDAARRQREIGTAWREWRQKNGGSAESVERFGWEVLPRIRDQQAKETVAGWEEVLSNPAGDAGAAEPTATNPQTGEKMILRGGQWVPAQ